MGVLSRRSRKLILICAALGIGGYASYRIYKSPLVSRKRRKLSLFLTSLSTLVEAFAQGIDSTSIVATDLRAFLQSDQDEIPRSVKQGLKLMRCREFQEALTGFSACISRGMLLSVNDPDDRSPSTLLEYHHGQVCFEQVDSTGVRVYQDRKKEQVVMSSDDENDKHVLSEGFPQVEYPSRTRKDLPERVMDKMFTDAGKGFASTVLGSVARNATLAFLEHGQTAIPLMSQSSFEPGSALLSLVSSSRGRSFVAECIQAFVGTAVSVYLEKTKDVNIYEEVVAGMTKPAHQPAVKELLNSVCSGAVETFVRTSHDVLTQTVPKQCEHRRGVELEELVRNLNTGKGKQEQEQQETDVEDKLSGKSRSSSLSPSSSSSEASYDLGESLERKKTTMLVVTEGGSSSKLRLPKWVEGLSSTLAVPSNRKLLIDVAGTVTSEAIHSFFEVFVGVVSPYLRYNLKQTRQAKKAAAGATAAASSSSVNAVGQQRSGVELWACSASRELLARSLVVLTVCLSIILHVLVGVRTLEAA